MRFSPAIGSGGHFLLIYVILAFLDVAELALNRADFLISGCFKAISDINKQL
jgi:hypothetical protein